LPKDRGALIRQAGLAIRMHQNAVDQVDEAASAYMEINRTDGRCLDILERTGRMTAGELALDSGLSTGAITAVIDRLEKAGYVCRLRDDRDRRRVLVELTEEAHRRVAEVYGPIAEQGLATLGACSDEQLILIRDFMNEGREFLSGYAASLREKKGWVADR